MEGMREEKERQEAKKKTFFADLPPPSPLPLYTPATQVNLGVIPSVSFEYQFPMKHPTYLLSVFIPAKYVISKSKLS